MKRRGDPGECRMRIVSPLECKMSIRSVSAVGYTSFAMTREEANLISFNSTMAGPDEGSIPNPLPRAKLDIRHTDIRNRLSPRRRVRADLRPQKMELEDRVYRYVSR